MAGRLPALRFTMSLLKHSPRFDALEAERVAEELYGINAAAKLLPSERDQNFLLETDDGRRFVLKIANSLESRAFLEAQCQAMKIAAQATGLCQDVVAAKTGGPIAEVRAGDGTVHLVRLVTFLAGTPLGNVRRHSDELLRDLGRTVAGVDRSLMDFDHPATRRDFHWDLVHGPRVIREYLPLVGDPKIRNLVRTLTDEYERDTSPLLPTQRQSVIHSDANDYNVLVGGGSEPYSKDQNVAGLVDFGDMVRSFTVGGLAVAVAYAILGKLDPLHAAAEIVRGYHAVLPLDENEIRALFPMIRLRLCMSVAIAAHQQSQRPDDQATKNE